MNKIALSSIDKENLLGAMKVPDTVSIDWQQPVITEKIVSDNQAYINCPNGFTYAEIPWTTLLDLHKLYVKDVDFETFFISNVATTVVDDGFTVCQSIHFEQILPVLYQLGITILFATHCTPVSQKKAMNNWGIHVEPFLHFPLNFHQNKHNKRNYLFGFSGAVNTHISRKEFKHINHKKGYIKLFTEWHFQKDVYEDQLGLNTNKPREDETVKHKTEEYKEVLSESLFSLCPEGAGPNSIRIWESIFSGSIPVVFSDHLMFPYLGTQKKWFVNFKQQSIKDLPQLLEAYSAEDITQLQTNLKTVKNFITSTKHIGSINYFFNEKYSTELYQNANTERKEKFHLLISLYDEHDEYRLSEYQTCLEHNLNNSLIEKIHVFVEYKTKQAKDNVTAFLKSISDEFEINYFFSEKPRNTSYNQLIEYANIYLQKKNIIIANTDIYFDRSLALTHKFDLTSTVLALTRWNVEDYLDRFGQVWKRKSWSQDSWIFKSPLSYNGPTINLGWLKCDNRFARELQLSGYTVINPSNSIKTWHLHRHTKQADLYADNFSIEGDDVYYVPIESVLDSIRFTGKRLPTILPVFLSQKKFIPQTSTTSKYVVLCEGRTGSNYLKSRLNLHEEITDYGEVFNPNKNMIKHKDYINRFGWENYFFQHFLLKGNTLSTGVKLKYDQLFLMRDSNHKNINCLHDLLVERKDIKIIHLKRRNLLELVASREVAKKTGQWVLTKKSERKELVTVELSPEKCEVLFNQIEEKQNRIEQLYKQHDAIEVFYEDLIDPSKKTMKEIVHFINPNISYCDETSNMLKQNQYTMQQVLSTYDELKHHFVESKWSVFFE